ncbi:hypothetical protein Tco_0710457 [Tanacetum coccineum]
MGEGCSAIWSAIPFYLCLIKNYSNQNQIRGCHLVFYGQIPPKHEQEGKGRKGMKFADPTKKSVMCSDDSTNQNLFVIRKTSTKKKLQHRQWSATHARIVSESVPEPARRRWSDIAIFETTQKLKGIQIVTPAEQEAADVMKALKDSRRMLGRQPGTGGSNEGTGEIPGVPDESIYADAEDDNEETESDSDDIYKYRINVCKNADTETKATEKTADITKEATGCNLRPCDKHLCAF